MKEKNYILKSILSLNPGISFTTCFLCGYWGSLRERERRVYAGAKARLFAAVLLIPFPHVFSALF